MFSTKGQPRRLTDAQVEEILAWAREPRSIRQLSRRYPVSASTIQEIIHGHGAHYAYPKSAHRPGRPRALTSAQVEEILDWARRRRTARQIAGQYGVSETTIGKVVGRGNYYKQPSPELRALNLKQRHLRMRKLRAQGFI